MPTWIETKQEIVRRNNSYDTVRRERIDAVEKITHRPLVVYATAFLERDKVQASRGEVTIDHHDAIGFDEVIAGVEGDSLDVLLHSPGGSAEAAEGIVSMLRSRFKNVRFLVPHMAKSAATMMCCAGDEILMDERSELGPIDPQMQLSRADGVVINAPAQAILQQFDKAKESLAQNPKQITAWLPILQPLGPSLLTECEAADNLSQRLVEEWLKLYMMKDIADRDALASKAAKYLADSKLHLSHGRRVSLEDLRALQLNVTDLRGEPALRSAVWGVYQAITWTFQDTGAFKIIENCHGGAYIRTVVVQEIRIPAGAMPPGAAPQQPPGKGKRKRH